MRRLHAFVTFFAPFWLVASVAQQPTPPADAAPQASAAPGEARPSFRPGQFYTIHRNVALVVLDGVAIDSQGRVVTDLKQSEFHITEDGAPQTIRNFEEPGKFTPPANVTIDSTADLDRLAPRAPVNIVLLDEFSTRFEDMAFARYSLKKWLEAQPVKLDTPTMLVAVTLEHFTVIRDYTQNKDEILNALDHHFAAYPWHMQQVTWSEDLYSAAHLALRRVAEATTGHRAHKTMIWIGRGFPSNRRDHFDTNVVTRPDSTTAHTLDELRDARITLYTIDPAGVMVNPEMAYPTSLWNYNPFGGDPKFQAIAAATGGQNFYNRNDVDREIGTSIRDGNSFYTLTYIPPDPDNNPQKLRHIKVTIDRPGITYLSRTAYFPESRPSRAGNNGEANNRLITEMVGAGDSNMQYDSVPFTITASPSDANDLHVHLSGAGVGYYIPRDESQPHWTRLVVLATTFDKKDKELKRDGRIFKFIAPPSAMEAGRVRMTPLNFEFKLAPNAKAARVRFVVRVESSGRMGTADMPMTPGATASSSAAQSASTLPDQPVPEKPEPSTPAGTPPAS